MKLARGFGRAILLGSSVLGASAIKAATPGGDIGWDVPLWRIAGALIFCLLLAGAAALIVRTRIATLAPFAAKGRRLRLLESMRLSHQADLCLIALDGRELVIVATPRGATLLLDRGEAPR